MINKERLKAHIEEFPEEFSIDELVERLVFIEKLEQRIQESKEGKTLTEAEFKTETDQWLK